MDSNTRIAFNTTILYAQLIITVAVNLFSTRLILNAMGVEDYGIVNLIAGIVAMLSFVQNSMTVSSQRYMSVYMGKHDDVLQKKVFNTSLMLHLLFMIGVLLVLELCEPLIFNSSIQIPDTRVYSTKILYQLTIIGTLLVIITVPYDATLNAHENMLMFSVFSIVESMIRLAGALILLVYNDDKLIFYGFLIVIIRLAAFILKSLYCKFHYKETSIQLGKTDRPLMGEMFSFAFWNMFGAFALTGRNQGLAIVLNTFFGVTVNAAYGIANQVGGQMSNFTSAISKAINPQIMQNAGANNNERVVSLALLQCKFSSLLLSVVVVPFFFTLPYILQLWLKIVPENCVEFCQCFLFVNLLSQMSSGLMSAVQSSGHIRNYQIIVSVILLLNLPMGFIALYSGLPALSVLICMIVVDVAALVFRLFFTRMILPLSASQYVSDVVKPVIFMLLISGLLSYAFNTIVLKGITSFSTFMISFAFSGLVGSIFAFMMLNKKEQSFVLSFVTKAKISIRNKI